VHPYKALNPRETPCYFQFERVGFFVPDYDSTEEHPIMNLTVALTDTYSILNEANCAAAQVTNLTFIFSLICYSSEKSNRKSFSGKSCFRT
jgi:hypothetical protein